MIKRFINPVISADDGYNWTAPVDTFPANKFGLKNMVGNVWEWTADWWQTNHQYSTTTTTINSNNKINKVKKGGSFMCHRSYCYRYRCAARHFNTPVIRKF